MELIRVCVFDLVHVSVMTYHYTSVIRVRYIQKII